MRRQTRSNRMWHGLVVGALASAALLLGACSSGPDTLDDAAADAVREVELPDGRLQLTLVVSEDDVDREAVLEETRASRGADRVFRVVQQDPPDGALGWIYPLIPPTASLELDGRVEPHPDTRPTAELLKLLDGRPPGVDAALAGLDRLHRLEGRASVLAKAAGLRTASSRAVDRIIDVLSAGPHGAFLGPVVQ